MEEKIKKLEESIKTMLQINKDHLDREIKWIEEKRKLQLQIETLELEISERDIPFPEVVATIKVWLVKDKEKFKEEFNKFCKSQHGETINIISYKMKWRKD